MKLTKLQRYTLYCMMLHELEIYDFKSFYMHDGFCFAFYHVFHLNEGLYSDVIDHYLPELKRKKPKKLYDESIGLWFQANKYGEEGVRNRIRIMKQCIKETHP